jgi:hypothetical protein
MGGFLGDELGYFSSAVVAGRHDVLEFLQRLIGLIEIFFLISVVVLGLVSLLFNRTWFTCVPTFQLRNEEFSSVSFITVF